MSLYYASLNNTVALCPNCHRRMHVLDDNADKKKLNSAAKQSSGPSIP